MTKKDQFIYNAIMTKREILEDFVVFYILSRYLIFAKNSIVRFFYDFPIDYMTNEDEVRWDYIKFLRFKLNLTEFIYDTENEAPVKKLSDIVTNDKINNLVDYLNNSLKETYLENDYLDDLEVTKLDLNYFFNNEYLIYHKINPNIYISYIYQLFQFKLSKNGKDYVERVEKIDSIFFKLEFLPEILKDDFKNHYDEKLKQKLFKSIISRPFQFQGFFDDKGSSLNNNLSFEKWLEASINFSIDYSFETVNRDIYGTDFIVYQYFKHKFFGESIYLGTKDEIDNKKSELEKFKSINNDLVQYLKAKNFESNEINVIINIISGGEFNEINIRTFPFKTQVDFFRLCYLFYIFDFLEEKKNINFETETDFENLIFNDYSKYDKSWNEQFRKNFKNISSQTNHRQYPFKRVENTIKLIEDDLKIEKGKLKPIPKTKYFSIQ